MVVISQEGLITCWHGRESSPELLHENHGFTNGCYWKVILLFLEGGFQVTSKVPASMNQYTTSASDKGMQLYELHRIYMDTQRVYRFSVLGHTTSINWSLSSVLMVLGNFHINILRHRLLPTLLMNTDMHNSAKHVFPNFQRNYLTLQP